MRLQSAQTPLREFERPRNLSNLSRYGNHCQPLRSQDFHPLSTAGSLCRDGLAPSPPSPRQTLFTARPKTRFHFSSPQYPAHAEAEDDSKIKDRLEALLFAETLQGTLSPNANPGKGSNGGLLNWMPQATARIQRAAQTHQSLVLDSILYTKPQSIAQGGKENSLRGLQNANFSADGSAGAPSLCLRSWQTQGGEFDSLSWRDSARLSPRTCDRVIRTPVRTGGETSPVLMEVKKPTLSQRTRQGAGHPA